MLARAAALPLPEAFQSQLEPALTRVSDTATAYLRASGTALAARNPMRRPALDKALDGYAAEMAASRRQDLGQEVTVDALERAFTVSFTLERLREAFRNLESCIAEQCTTRMPRTTVDPS